MKFKVPLSIIAAIFSGFILQFISPPVNLHYLHWFSYVPVLLATDSKNFRTSFGLGYICGFVGIFFIFNWLYDVIVLFSNLSPSLAWLVLVLFSAVLALPYALAIGCVGPLRQRFPKTWIFLFPALWVALEFLTPNLFPYYQGLSQYRIAWVWQLASAFGAYGVSYLILLTNAAITEIIFYKKKSRTWPRVSLISVILILLTTLVFGAWRHHNIEKILATAPVIKMGRIQVSDVITRRHQLSAKEQFTLYETKARTLANQDMDLMIWPEGAIHLNLFSPYVKNHVRAITQNQGFMLLAGGGRILHDAFNPNLVSQRNASLLFTPDGDVASWYDKMVLIPFGEYLPWPFDFLKGKIEGPQNFQTGHEATVFDTGLFQFTTPICYEAILDSQVEKMLGGDFLINITDDGWFMDSKASYQHAMLAASMAMKYGIPLVRVAANGISLVVEPHGNIRYETKLFEDVADVMAVRRARFNTAYQQWGWMFPYLCLALSLWVLFQILNSRSRSRT